MQLLQGDCLELMHGIPDGSVDMVLCDLPYGTTNCKWDKRLPIDELWAQYRRVLKQCGVIALFGSEPFSTKMRMAAMNLFKYDWIWEKPISTGFVHAKNMPMKNYEIISVFSNGSVGHKSTLGNKRMPYNPQGICPVFKMKKAAKNKFGTIAGERPSHKNEYMVEYGNYPTMVLRFPQVCAKSRLHPTQKPVTLLEYLIKTYTNPGETVLDNCMGSGSTGVACVNTGREFIGIELDPDYFRTAQERIEATQAQLSMGINIG